MNQPVEIDQYLGDDARDDPNGTENRQQDARLRDLAHDIKSGIDSEGRFSNNLTAMSKGYAAGADIHEPVARRMITSAFQSQYEKTPMEYLEEHRSIMEGIKNERASENDHEL